MREAIRAVEDNLLGESMISVYALVSLEFFDKLIGHALRQDAYKFYAATGAQPLRQDVRRNFPFAGILFEEYRGTVTLSTGAAERLIPAGEGVAFATAMTVIFADRNMAVDALWLAGGIGPGVAVRVIRKSPDEIPPFGAGRILSEKTQLDARVADLPTPAPTVSTAAVAFGS